MTPKLLKHLQQQRVSCVLLVPKIWASWRKLLESATLASVIVAKPYEDKAFTITLPGGRRVPKKYPHAMEAVYVSFEP